ncbi:MAG: autotransporter domain-containing protein [Thermoguttaceae bacterium]|nr:autotransporter domain-containing protein [Thermoguttaceae bacterium]
MKHNTGWRRNAQLYLSLGFMVVFATWSTQLAHATNYNLGSLKVTTFEDSVKLNGSSISLTSRDKLVFSGGTIKITGNGPAYSALLGTGTGAKAGFSWGPGSTCQSGGTIDLSQGVTLNINVAAGTSSPLSVIPLTQIGEGTLNLTSSRTQNLALTQKSGTLNITGNVLTLGTALINGTMNVGGDFTAKANSAAVESVTVNGTLTVTGEFEDLADQTTVNGTLIAQSANFSAGGLLVNTGGTFQIEDQACFSTNTAVVTHGNMVVGDDSQLDSTTVGDAGTMTVGNGTAMTGVFSCTGSFTGQGDTTFNHCYAYGDIEIAGNAVFNGEFEGGSGTLDVDQSATFNDIAHLENNMVVTVKQDALFQNTLSISDTAQMNIGGNLTSNANITVDQGTLDVGGNITTTGSLTTTGTATLGLSTRLQGADLGNVEAGNGINLASTTIIKTDLSGFPTNSQPTLLLHMTAGDSTSDFQVDGASTDTATVAAFFGSSTVLRKIYAVDNGAGYDIYGRVSSLHDEAIDEDLMLPAVDAGDAVDDLISQVKPNDPTSGMVDDLLNQTDKDAISQTPYNLATGYGVENVFAMTLVNLGQAGSPFFFGKATGMPQTTQECCSVCRRDDCCRVNTGWELWGAPFYQTLDAGGNFFQDGFNLHEAGLIVGARKHYSSRMSAGVLFAYGAPRLRQSGSLLGYDAHYRSDLDMDDYQFAAHFEYETQNEFRFALFAGGGAQRLSLYRNASGTAANETKMNRDFTGNTDGNSLAVTAYLARPFQVGAQTVLSPVVGIDCMYAWLYGFGEDSSGTGNWQDMTNLSEGNFYSPVSYGKTDYNRIMARVGLMLEYTDAQGGLACQAFYASQMGGNDCAIVPVSTLGGAFNSGIYGYGPGRDSLNLGGGLWRYLNADESLTGSVSYNYFTLSSADASNVTAALTWRY